MAALPHRPYFSPLSVLFTPALNKGPITNSFFVTGKIDADSGLFFLLAAIGDGGMAEG